MSTPATAPAGSLAVDSDTAARAAWQLKLLPLMGKLVANDADSYQYLAESIRMHPGQEELKTMMENAGFAKVSYHNLTAGVVALHKGFKV